jgi:hypothetical protein
VSFAALHMSARGTGLPSENVRIHGEYWRVSGPCAGVFRTAALDLL